MAKNKKSKSKKPSHKAQTPSRAPEQRAAPQPKAERALGDGGYWLIEPRDTLVIRNARPASSTGVMETLPFPWPSSIAGLARTRAGLDPQTGVFDTTLIDALKGVEVKGPWLARLDEDGDVETLFCPAPLDCLWHKIEGDDEQVERRRLRPQPSALWVGERLPLALGLEPVAPDVTPPQTKPAAAPSFWAASDLENWLTAPMALERLSVGFGLKPLAVEERVHVAIDEATGRPKDGALFSTQGLRFQDEEGHRFGVVFGCADPRIKPGALHLGGERRISFLSSLGDAVAPKPPEVSWGRRLRLILTTPAIFEAGWRPSDAQLAGAKLVGAVVGRPEVISGWDFERPGPKMCRRMAPAGSVYWVDLPEEVDVVAWVKARWMSCLSDDPQDRADGFGLCLVGVG
ncbi:type III-B CRISPR module-associated protein Cmr3 [Myxococcota bacterium]|nr:type III-B CRISPR module-associated protein Cmr3 [Myxococcota bacterium]MBU1898333.1 type III-B CRISPR module-associated protein Cmr3 [Myxococcota bacterium]